MNPPPPPPVTAEGAVALPSPLQRTLARGWLSGRLMLLGNDKGNAEFEHLNRLAAKFGLEFLEQTYPKTAGKGILIATGASAIFENGLNVYLVEVAPLKISGDASVLLEHQGTPIMALAKYGKGRVFALGDPWIYNEYIDHKDNRRIATNLLRLLLTGKE